MRPIKYIILLSLFIGCSEDKEFDFVLPIEIEAIFVIQEADGFWDETDFISYEDVEDALEDLEDDIDFQQINVEGVTLIIENQDPALTGVENVDLYIVDPQNQTSFIYMGESITIPAGQARTEVVVTNLAEQGVLALKDLLEGYALAESFETFTIVSTGQSTPQGTPLNMTLTVVLHLSMNYSQELNVPYFLGN